MYKLNFFKSICAGMLIVFSQTSISKDIEFRLAVPAMVENAVPSEPVVKLYVSNDTIRRNENITLNWSGTRFSSITINGQQFNGNPGHLTLSPTVDTQYVATATNASGQGSGIVSVRVLDPEPTLSANLSPQTIFNGQSSTLTWSSTDTSHVSISNIPGIHASDGTLMVSPSKSETYSIRAFGDESIAENEIALTVLKRNTQSCLSLKQQDPSLSNGIYNLDSGDFYCDMTSGGWTLIFNQSYEDSNKTGYFNESRGLAYRTASPSLNNNYSNLDKMESFRRNGQFELKMAWPGSVSGVNHWIQTNSLAENTPSSGYKAISVPYTGNYWQGLERNCTYGCNLSFVDGSVEHTNWWFAIGSYAKYRDLGIPGPNSIIVPRVQLYVK